MSEQTGEIDIEAVRSLAARVRRALHQGGYELETLKGFPRGSCGDASEMLGQMLRDHGLGRWIYTSHRDIPSHAWLEHELWLLDITSDQFNDRPKYAPRRPAVLLTRDRSWHDRHFATHPGYRPAGMEHFGDGEVGDRARRDYALLLERLRG